MKAILIRIGVDHSYGKWNAPADPDTGEFVYVPIPESNGTTFHQGCERRYSDVLPSLCAFADARSRDLDRDLRFPAELRSRSMHLDPDFETLTYGDVGDRRGSHLREMSRGDLVVFYAGLRSILDRRAPLIYALVGILVVEEIVLASSVPDSRWNENAHTRKIKRGDSDIVVRAGRKGSGRLKQFLDIGEYRNRAYRVRRDVEDAWGGLSVKDGYLQRSARPPRFLKPEQFCGWLEGQRPELIQENF